MSDNKEMWKGARRLDALLEEAGLSNVGIAKELGVDDSTVSRYRSGERAPGPDELAAICKLADLSADDILGLGDDASPANRLWSRIRALDQGGRDELASVLEWIFAKHGADPTPGRPSTSQDIRRLQDTERRSSPAKAGPSQRSGTSS